MQKGAGLNGVGMVLKNKFEILHESRDFQIAEITIIIRDLEIGE